jgi:uncharacterized membrane protein
VKFVYRKTPMKNSAIILLLMLLVFTAQAREGYIHNQPRAKQVEQTDQKRSVSPADNTSELKEKNERTFFKSNKKSVKKFFKKVIPQSDNILLQFLGILLLISAVILALHVLGILLLPLLILLAAAFVFGAIMILFLILVVSLSNHSWF